MDQGSNEWYAARLGKVTASRIADLMAKTKSGYSTSRKNYMAQLVVERMTGATPESFSNKAMQWGTETEPFAREAYEIMTGNVVEEVGFVDHKELFAGASPDGLVGEDGLLEIKCPLTHTHINTLLTQKVDAKYIKQMHWQMICTGRKWCDFVSYDPRMPEGLKFWQKRVELDQALASEIETEVEAFIAELDHMETQLRNVAA